MSNTTVKKWLTGQTVTMGDGSVVPETRALITRDDDGATLWSGRLNATTLCLPEGSVNALEAADSQIVRAILGDESVFAPHQDVDDDYDACLEALRADGSWDEEDLPTGEQIDIIIETMRERLASSEGGN